ncbi:hypothetical protein E1288_17650 [Saccharopolyspora elongata]|uniref:Uncharacterized protein n=1 Tax=Saccharopolyspora elongata TaxID=2530387 RepID=A0A4R4Z0C0_9PSEU|nr:hypothetical protein E1288_17650 [Saccharopolyspora elongata]
MLIVAPRYRRARTKPESRYPNRTRGPARRTVRTPTPEARSPAHRRRARHSSAPIPGRETQGPPRDLPRSPARSRPGG